MADAGDAKAGSTRPTGTLRAAQKEATRRRLMDTAMQVFVEKGYAATTVEDIARGAGASTATFYLHFKRKIDVLRAVVADADRGVSYLTKPLRTADHPLTTEELRAWASRLFRYWHELRASHQVLNQAVLIEPELRPLRAKRLKEGIQYWESFLRGFGARAGKRLSAEAALLNAQIYGLFEMWIVAQVELDEKLLVELLADTLERCIRRVGSPNALAEAAAG